MEELYKDDPERLALYRQTDKQVLEEKNIVSFEEAVEQAGRMCYYWITKFPLLDDEGSVRNIGVLASDITELKETELKLIESRKEAEHAKEAQEAFLANMSHEIRTPMNGIIGMSNLLMGTKLNEEQKDFTQSIQESARSLLSIINDLLDFSKIKSGKFQLEHSSFDIRNSIGKALHPLQFRAEEKNLNLQLNIEDNVPEILIGDPLRLQQIIINLAGNSLKFTAHGSVTVTVRSETISDKNISLHVSVKDTGIGIAEEKLDKIFESFTQSKAEDARKYGGTGLGLAIVKQLVELQNGTISVQSLEGKGSEFTFSIPYERSEAKAYDAVIEQSFGAVQLLEDIRILVAEDNLINQKVVKSTLSKQGAIVTVAGNGQEAIQQMKQHGFDLILMDLQMPEMDGYRATRYIRQIIKTDIPIIAMTADAIKGEEEKCYEAGMNAYISKPFDPNDLYNRILQLTNRKVAVEVHHGLEMPDEIIVDFSFLKELADNDSSQIYEILDIFLDTMPAGMNELRSLINESADPDKISKQAHFLKSSVGVVKVKDMYQLLAGIESLAAAGQNTGEIKELFKKAMDNFTMALPLVQREKELHRSASF
jgi:signal transduction histidine kinase/DNA-binding response OmpR family regulator